MKQVLFAFLFMQCFTIDAQKLVSFEVLPCNKTIGLNFYNNRIVSKFQQRDTLYLQISFVANCGIEYDGKLSYRPDSLILEFENVSEAYMACQCLFFMNIVISEAISPNSCIFINNKEYSFTKKHVDLPPETIHKKDLKNRYNKEGQKTGFWAHTSKTGSHSISYYENGVKLWQKSYSRNGLLSEVEIRHQYMDDVTYYCIDAEEYEKMIREEQNN